MRNLSKGKIEAILMTSNIEYKIIRNNKVNKFTYPNFLKKNNASLFIYDLKFEYLYFIV